MSKLILRVVDFFYPLFRKIMPLQTFRYTACGGFNTALDIIIFYFSFHYIFQEQVVHIGNLAMKPHNASLIAAFFVSFPLGFYFSRYVVFSGSSLRGRVHLMRYLLIVLACIALNYLFLTIFVEQLNFYPTIAKIFTTIIVVSFSFFTQKHFTFKSKTIKIKLSQ